MARTIDFVARIEKILVVAFADELIELGFGEGLFIEIARSEVDLQFEQETSCFTAGGSCGLLVEGDVLVGHLSCPLNRDYVEVEILRPNCGLRMTRAAGDSKNKLSEVARRMEGPRP